MSKHTQKPWKVDGAYACGKDIGSPSGVSIFETDCCGQIAGKDNDEIEANGRLIVAAPEMYELIEQVADLQNARFDGAAYMELVEEMDRVADLAQDLLARIKGGRDE